MSFDLFREAVRAAHNNDEKSARALLQELLLGQPRHELGWLWLSKVSIDLDEQINALEKALTINPERKETKLRLETLRHQQANQYRQLPESSLYQEAIAEYKNGRAHRARELLEQIVQNDPKHEKAWLGLSNIGYKPEEKIVALEMALALNPHNSKVQTRLQKLKLNQEDQLAMGLAYEKFGQYGRALSAYQIATRNAISTSDKHIARKHYLAIKTQADSFIEATLAQQKIVKTTSANSTLIRLALGPIIIYMMLLFIHGGLNPLKIPFLFYLGIIGVVIGSLLTVGAANTPHHPFWQKILGPEGITDNTTRAIMTSLGLLFILIPFGIVFLSGLTRIAQLRETLAIGLP